MTKPNIKPVTIIFADSGPLISLALIDRLDLLQSFGRPVFITDTVVHECTRLIEKPGAAPLKEWFENKGANQYRLIETPLGDAYLKAVELSEQGIPNSAKNFGEYSIHWALSNIEALANAMKIPKGDHFGLVLSEDKGFLNSSPPPNAHLLSTRAFLITLTEVGLIADAENLRAEIKAAGRTGLSKSLIDKPLKTDGLQTDYRLNFLETVADRIRDRKGTEENKADDQTNGPRFK
jgi:hypothetical protein